MNRVVLKVDQWVSIGKDIGVSPTDIDSKSVRLIARGRELGGPNDGGDFEKTHELRVGSSVNLGPHVAVTLVEVRGKTARLDVFAPANVAVKSHGK
jgi:sRNA-binding carbon storage regulator CsrA